MNRFNWVFTLVIGIIFVLLMFFAGQPITPEADLVQRWYDTLCNPAANQLLLYAFTWRGSESDTEFQTIIDAFRANYGYTNGCTAVENHNIIYFQSIPPELASAVDQIKFVAFNVFAPDQPHDLNHVLSIRAGVHVLFYNDGAIKILPHFIPDSPLGLYQGLEPVTLYNNDGLLMGQVYRTGDLIQIPQNDVVRYGIPLQFSTVHNLGMIWIRIYADGIQVEAERFANVLPDAFQDSFLPAYIENLAADKVVKGVIWFPLPNTGQPADVRISVDMYQTIWDMPGLPIIIKVQ